MGRKVLIVRKIQDLKRSFKLLDGLWLFRGFFFLSLLFSFAGGFPLYDCTYANFLEISLVCWRLSMEHSSWRRGTPCEHQCEQHWSSQRSSHGQSKPDFYETTQLKQRRQQLMPGTPSSSIQQLRQWQIAFTFLATCSVLGYQLPTTCTRHFIYLSLKRHTVSMHYRDLTSSKRRQKSGTKALILVSTFRCGTEGKQNARL